MGNTVSIHLSVSKHYIDECVLTAITEEYEDTESRWPTASEQSIPTFGGTTEWPCKRRAIPIEDTDTKDTSSQVQGTCVSTACPSEDSTGNCTEDSTDGRKRKKANPIGRTIRTWRQGDGKRQLIKLVAHRTRDIGKDVIGQPCVVDSWPNWQWAWFSDAEWQRYRVETRRFKYCRPMGYTVYARKKKCMGYWYTIGNGDQGEPQGNKKMHGNPVPVRTRVRVAPTATNTLHLPGMLPSYGQTQASFMDNLNNVTTIGTKWTKIREFRVPKIVKVGHGALVVEGNAAKPTTNVATYFEAAYGDVDEVNFFDDSFYVACDLYDNFELPIVQSLMQTNYFSSGTAFHAKDYPITAINLAFRQDVEVMFNLYFEAWGDGYPYDD